MCLAVLGRIVQADTINALADVEGNRVQINIQLTPDVGEGEYVLIHAGFAIATVPEEEFFTTQHVLDEIAELVSHAEPK